MEGKDDDEAKHGMLTDTVYHSRATAKVRGMSEDIARSCTRMMRCNGSQGLLLDLTTLNHAAVPVLVLPAKHLSISFFGEVFFLLQQLIHGGFLSNAEACPCLHQAGQVVHLQLQLADHVLGPGFLQHDSWLSYSTAKLTCNLR